MYTVSGRYEGSIVIRSGIVRVAMVTIVLRFRASQIRRDDKFNYCLDHAGCPVSMYK